MKKALTLILGFFLLVYLTPFHNKTFAQPLLVEGEVSSGAVVCEPGLYTGQNPSECLPIGPSQFLARVNELGLTIPPRPLPASSPDPALTYLPYRYFKLDEEIVPIYSSPGQTGPGGQNFWPGFVYISYIDRVDVNGIYYLMEIILVIFHFHINVSWPVDRQIAYVNKPGKYKI